LFYINNHFSLLFSLQLYHIIDHCKHITKNVYNYMFTSYLHLCLLPMIKDYIFTPYLHKNNYTADLKITILYQPDNFWMEVYFLP